MMHFSFRNPTASELFEFWLMTCPTLHNPAMQTRHCFARLETAGI